MNDQEYKYQKKRIQALVKKWVKPLGLRWWRIELEYSRESKDGSEPVAYRPPTRDGNWITAFATAADPYYLTATITCYFPVLKDISDSDLEEYFLHELMHVFLSPMRHTSTHKEEELVATRLSQAFCWVRRGT